MCGVVGIVWADPTRRTPPGLTARMTQLLAHRGPDGAGMHEEPGVSLGHRRLSVIDLAAGAQPMSSADGEVWIVFNGEIYNYIELRERLIAGGRVFRTASDTEVLLQLYEEEGPDLVHQIGRAHV